MNYVDLGLLIILICSIIGGYKSGVIKTSVKLVSLIISAVVAYQLKDYLASFLIDFLPFFSFRGIFEGVTAMNVMFYHGVSFLVIFLIMSSILNIVIILAGFLDKLLKMTIILYLPDKILGGLVGFIYGTVWAFIIIFVLAQIPSTQIYVIDSAYGYKILNRTPVIRTVLADSTIISSEIADVITNIDTEGDYIDEAQLAIMKVFVKYGLVSPETAQNLVDEEKVYLPGIIFQ